MTNAVLEDLKSRSTARLAELGATVPDHLPLIEGLAEVGPRSARDVAGRACALSYVVGMAFGADPEELWRYLREFSLDKWVTPRERRRALDWIYGVEAAWDEISLST